MTVHLFDEVIPGQLAPAESVLLPRASTTARDLIRSRVQQEVERHNQSLPEVFCGLVQPEESERILNGFRMKSRRPLDWKAQFERACAGFERNGFLLLVDGRQIGELDEPIDLRIGSEVRFLKLVPLVGG